MENEKTENLVNLSIKQNESVLYYFLTYTVTILYNETTKLTNAK